MKKPVVLVLFMYFVALAVLESVVRMMEVKDTPELCFYLQCLAVWPSFLPLKGRLYLKIKTDANTSVRRKLTVYADISISLDLFLQNLDH